MSVSTKHCIDHGAYVSIDDAGCEKCPTIREQTAQRKRDRFELAKAAMQGILSNSTCKTGTEFWMKNVAMDALDAADALLAELDKEPTQ